MQDRQKKLKNDNKTDIEERQQKKKEYKLKIIANINRKYTKEMSEECEQ